MDSPRSNNLLVVALIVAGAILPFAIYVMGYFFSSDRVVGRGHQARIFPWRWVCAAYSPAARLESMVRETSLGMCYPKRDAPGEILTYTIYDAQGQRDPQYP